MHTIKKALIEEHCLLKQEMPVFGEKPGPQSVPKRVILRMDALEEESEYRVRFCLPLIWVCERTCSSWCFPRIAHCRFVAVIPNVVI